MRGGSPVLRLLILRLRRAIDRLLNILLVLRPVGGRFRTIGRSREMGLLLKLRRWRAIHGLLDTLLILRRWRAVDGRLGMIGWRLSPVGLR